MPITELRMPSVRPVRFAGVSEFASAVNAEGPQVEQQLPALFKDVKGPEALKVYDAIKKAGGLSALIKAVAGALPVEAQFGFLKDLATGSEAAKAGTDLGRIVREGNKTVIYSFDNDKPTKVEFDTATRPQVFGPETDGKTFLKKTLGDAPRIIIGPVGWTVPDMAAALESDRQFQKVVNGQLKGQVAEAIGADKGEQFEAAFTRAKKDLAGQLYQLAFEKFWEPIDHLLFEKEGGPKLDPSKFVFLTSASYDGIDKAAMDYADKKNIKVLNVTPFCYTNYMDTKRKDPMLVTKDIDGYAKVYNELANVLLVTGGRAHAANQDAKRSIFDEQNAVIPVDIMAEFGGFNIPGLNSSGVANAAKLLLDMGFDAAKSQLAKNVPDGSGLTDAQKAVAGNLITLYNKIASVDTNALAQKAAAKVLAATKK